jgi:hypothetical protein
MLFVSNAGLRIAIAHLMCVYRTVCPGRVVWLKHYWIGEAGHWIQEAIECREMNISSLSRLSMLLRERLKKDVLLQNPAYLLGISSVIPSCFLLAGLSV